MELAGATEKGISDIVLLIKRAINAGNKIVFFGNGGSAADAQHIAAEFTGRYNTNRRALPGLALTTDTSALTAIANDFGYNEVFARQIKALASPGDVLIGISTSGNSPNVVSGLNVGKEIGCKLIGLSGGHGGKMVQICDVCIIAPSTITARIQEMHILIGHIICECLDNIYE